MTAPALARILLVDDQRDIRSIVGLALGKIGGFKVKVCASGAEALAGAAEFAPDLLLLDLNMPEMDGVATLRALRATGLAAPAVFFTARIKPEELGATRTWACWG